MTTTLNNVTNQLLNEYSVQFNENYNDIVQLNSTIQNKEEIIIQTNQLILYRERYIIILQYILYLSIIVFLLSALLGLKIIDFKSFMGIFVIVFILLFISCYLHIARHFSYINIKNKMDAVKVAMVDYSKKIQQNRIPEYQCPSTCTNNQEEEDNNNNNTFDYNNSGTTLKIDPSLNVWKYGDVPIGSELDSEIEPGDEPRPFFGTSYPQTIYYQCKWLGNRGGKNMPKQMIQSMKKYSTIPCTYRPNNTEKSRLFCQKDPNNLDADQINKYCQEFGSEEIENTNSTNITNITNDLSSIDYENTMESENTMEN